MKRENVHLIFILLSITLLSFTFTSSKKTPNTKKELENYISKAISQNGIYADLNYIDVSNITDMSYLFKDSKFNGDISNWDVFNVTDMSHMFSESDFFDDISKWDVSNVIDMSSMFYESRFNGYFSNWDVSNVTDMSSMFFSSQFNGDISDWDVSNVTDMSAMFFSSQFNNDISKWDVSNVIDMRWLFANSPFEGDLSKWNVSNVTDMSAMFYKSRFNGYLSNWDVSNVTDMSSMFFSSQFNNDISKWDVSNVTNTSGMFKDSNFKGDISKWVNITTKFDELAIAQTQLAVATAVDKEADSYQSDLDQAVADLEALENKSGYVGLKSTYLLALKSFSEEDYQTALDNFVTISEKASGTYMGSLSLSNAAVCAEQLGDETKTVEYCQQLIDTYGNGAAESPKAMFTLARIYEKQNNSDLAQGQFQQLADQFPSSEYGKLAQNSLLNY